MKKVILIAFAFVLLACGAVENENGASACDNGGEQGCTLEDSSTIKQELTDQKPFEKTNITTVFTMLENKESGIVYFGFSDCPWCQEALPILKQVLEEQKLNCYYVQTRDEERNSLLKEEEKADIMEKSMDFLQRDEENNTDLYRELLPEQSDEAAEFGDKSRLPCALPPDRGSVSEGGNGSGYE